VSAWDDVRALARARVLIDGQLAPLVVRALEEGADRTAVAHVLGISRATLYREFGRLLKEQREKGSAS